ncbi:ANTAR domain-containing response regulator [Mycolicibacterium psychrotolerans]|uniref:ANTAR domain-containing protein n=1 Tax=Mycolicibacterium psychrotolerans TaxID=216929 RepID=A0A7I7M824_9MYCO|nr:ANTAR domain-containing protein [Mycolicibacterium psychrotolerans]BBX67519.1 hypothetical protein MPSYJ_09800 [Mycolicibacterium psychrotolerans]
MTGARTTSRVDHADTADLQREIAHLHDKLASQPVIEQAKGMLMQTFGMDADGAFDILRAMSQNCNVKLRALAQFIVESWTRDGPRADFDLASDLLLDLRERLRAREDATTDPYG